MKKTPILILFLLLSFAFKAQQTNTTIPHSYDLTGPQYDEWTNFYNNWRITEYPKILQENKLKMNCSTCESVYMEVLFVINEIGKLDHYEVLKSKKCNEGFSKKLEKRFMKAFMDFQFPKDMRSIKFEARLGTGLKC